MGNRNSPLPMMLIFAKARVNITKWILCEALDISRQTLVKSGTQKADLSIKKPMKLLARFVWLQTYSIKLLKKYYIVVIYHETLYQNIGDF